MRGGANASRRCAKREPILGSNFNEVLRGIGKKGDVQKRAKAGGKIIGVSANNCAFHPIRAHLPRSAFNWVMKISVI